MTRSGTPENFSRRRVRHAGSQKEGRGRRPQHEQKHAGVLQAADETPSARHEASSSLLLVMLLQQSPHKGRASVNTMLASVCRPCATRDAESCPLPSPHRRRGDLTARVSFRRYLNVPDQDELVWMVARRTMCLRSVAGPDPRLSNLIRQQVQRTK